MTSNPLDFDIYYLPAGVYWSDAVNGTNGAKHDVYTRNGQDVRVTITEEDLGGIDLTIWQSVKLFFYGGSGKNFQLSMEKLFQTLY